MYQTGTPFSFRFVLRQEPTEELVREQRIASEKQNCNSGGRDRLGTLKMFRLQKRQGKRALQKARKCSEHYFKEGAMIAKLQN